MQDLPPLFPTDKREVTGAKRGENEAVLLGLEPSNKGELFCHGEIFFLLTGPLMGDPTFRMTWI
jgi:hypothetical protein